METMKGPIEILLNPRGARDSPYMWFPGMILCATCVIFRIGSVPGAPGARRWHQRAANRPKISDVSPPLKSLHLQLPTKKKVGAVDVAKLLKFIKCGDMDATKPPEFMRFGAMDVTKPCEFMGFGAMDVTKPYEFI